MNRSVRNLGLPALCIGAFLLTVGAARGAQACDLTSASWGNRDDDLDGFCNNVDLCPYDKDTINDGKSCPAAQAVAVPWIPSSTSAPHSTYAGATITLMGIGRNGVTQYKWDYGDATGNTGWIAVNTADPTAVYRLTATHAYNGDTGHLYIATLYAGDGPLGSPVHQTTSAFYVQIQAQALNPASPPSDAASTDVLANMAIDRALWYLHNTIVRGQYGDGPNGYAQPYGYINDSLAATCVALDAFQLHGSNMLIKRGDDPYQEDTQRLLNYVLVQAQQVGVGAKGIPTGTVYANYNLSPNDGIGIRFGGDDTYTNGICGVAVGSGLTGGFVAMTGPGDVYNFRTDAIMQRVVDWFAQYQHAGNDWARGGWWYSSGSNGADGSTNQWPILAMTAAKSINVDPPAFVKQETPYFIANSEHTAADTNNGGWGYTNGNTGDYLNVAKTAAGMLEHYFVGDTQNQIDVQRGMGFMYRHWSDCGDGTDCGWGAHLGHTYAMYGAMKSMRVPGIARIKEFNYSTGQQTGNSFDWYYTPAGQAQTGLATYLIPRQAANGTWTDPAYNAVNTNQTTAWDTLILTKGVTNIPPTASICNCNSSWDKGQPVTFDGTCSLDASPRQSIAKYEWDFNYNGSTFNTTIVSGYPTSQGIIVNQNGYSYYTQDHNGNPLAGVTPPVVALRVTDTTTAAAGGPLTSLAKCNVNIKPPPHCPNITTGSPAGGGPYLASVNQAFSVDASASFDVDQDPITFAWDFHNNGLFNDATGAKASYTFALPGTYVIGVAGTDHPEGNAVPYNPCTGGCSPPYMQPNGDCTVKQYTTVQVGAHTPIARTTGPYTSIPNNTITLDASPSSDPDNLPLTYAWDLTGGGAFTAGAKTQTFTVGNVAVGTSYTVCVEVNNGAQTSKPACTSVSVIAKQVAPICNIISPQVVAVCTGGAQKIQIDGSQSYDINGDAITYKWTTANCPATFDNATASVVNLAFNTAFEGCSLPCTATLTVNNGYYTSSCNANIDIVDTAAPKYTTAPSNLVLECGPTTTSDVNAWLAGPAAADNCAPAGSAVAMSNDFKSGTGCGGVGSAAPTQAGNSVNVTWSAQDVCSSSATSIGQKSATVTVRDTTAPVMSLPAPIAMEATAASTPVTWTATATDFVTANPAVICSPVSGSTFPLGVTTVNCSSTDGAGNKAVGSFTVTIKDSTPPTLAVPAPISLEATSASGAIATYAVSATDLVDGATAVTCAPASGSTFPIGVTTVSCSSTDAHANTGTKTFTVTVKDTTPPVVTVPQNMVAEATGPAGATVTFASTAQDIVDGATAVTCAPASGSTFALGITTVTCTSTDAHSNTGTNSFTVKVQDTTAPTFAGAAVTSGLTEEATSGAGMTLASYGVTASDIVDGATAVVCAPALPNTFPLGKTAVNCTSTDKAGNVAPLAFTVTVIDTTPPALTCPTPATIPANGPGGAENLNANEPTSNALKAFFAQAKAVDLVDPNPSLTNNAPWLFPSGQATTVTFTSTDAHQNTSTCTTTVTVTYENEPNPALTCPANISLANGGSEIDWTAAFRRPVKVDLQVTAGSPAAGALALAELASGAAQLTKTATAVGSYSVRIRATDEVSGLAVECNRFIATQAAAAGVPVLGAALP